MIIRLLTAFINIIMFCAPVAAFALPIDIKIECSVGRKAITSEDISSRIRLISLLSGQVIDMNRAAELKSQVLNMLIEEEIQRQIAEKMKMELDEGDIEKRIADEEEKRGLSSGGFAGFLGAGPFAAFKAQLKASILWAKYMEARYSPAVFVTKDETSSVKRMIERGMCSEKVLLAEIVVCADKNIGMEGARSVCNKIMSMIREGVPFASLAQQFSQSKSKVNSGIVGWKNICDLPKEVRDEIAGKEPGDIVGPVTVHSGNFVTIIAISDRASADKKDITDDEIEKTIRDSKMEMWSRKEITDFMTICPAKIFLK